MNETFLIALLGLATAANRAAEFAKGVIDARFPDLTVETKSLLALLVSLAAGIVGALALNINILALLPETSSLAAIPPLVGVILTGCIASAGSEGIHIVFDLLYGVRDNQALKASSTVTYEEKTTVPSTASAQATGGTNISRDTAASVDTRFRP